MGRSTVRITYQPLILTVHGEKPTVPADINALPGDIGWLNTDILLGQHAYNVIDNKFYIRSLNGIEPFNTSFTYIHDQGVPSDRWIIDHGLNKIPSITIVDTSKRVVECSITQGSTLNQSIATSNSPFAGKAYCI